MAIFVVTRVQGASWDPSLSTREQRAWDAHAAFMDGLVDAGFVVLGGPLPASSRALLVVEAADEGEIEWRLGDDPWEPLGLLHTGVIEPWTIWLDGTRRRSGSF